MLAQLKQIEREFGRRASRRWGPRVLDLDIALWSGGKFRSRRLTIPHSQLCRRSFVLQPLAVIARAGESAASPCGNSPTALPSGRHAANRADKVGP